MLPARFCMLDARAIHDATRRVPLGVGRLGTALHPSEKVCRKSASAAFDPTQPPGWLRRSPVSGRDRLQSPLRVRWRESATGR